MDEIQESIELLKSMCACRYICQGQGHTCERASVIIKLLRRLQMFESAIPLECICSYEQGQLKHHPQCEANQHRRA